MRTGTHPWRLGPAVVTAVLYAASGFAGAQTAAPPSSHVHGEGSLRLALDDVGLHIELTCPAADVVGFEHLPRSEADAAILERAASVLRDGDSLYLMPWDAGCRLAAVELERLAASRADPPGAAAGAPARGPASPADDATPRGPPGDTAAAPDASHVDIHAVYRFTCVRPERLDRIDLALFDLFPALRRLHVRYDISPLSGERVATPEDPLLRF